MPRPRSRPSRQFLEDSKRMQEKRQLREVGMLTGGQAKIAAKAPPTNKIDEKDFAVLRAEKAKDRGMGLQDEKVKPGKVIKAKRGTGILSEKGTSKNFKGYSKVFEGPQNKGRVATISGVKPRLPKPSKESSIARRALRGVKATRLGKIVLPIAAAGVAAQQYLKSKMKKKKEEPKKKMGGGMMNKPIMAREGRLAAYAKKKGLPMPLVKKPKFLNLGKMPFIKGIGKKDISKKMGGGMMKVPGYSSGTTDPIKTFGPNTRRPPERRQNRMGQQARRSVEKRAGVGNLPQQKKDDPFKSIIITKGGMYAYTKPEIEEKKGRNYRQHKSYDASPRLISDAKGKTMSLRSMMGGGMMKPMGYKSGKSIKVKCKLGKNKPTKMY